MAAHSKIASIVLQAILFAKLQVAYASDASLITPPLFQVPFSEKFFAPSGAFSNHSQITILPKPNTLRESESASKQSTSPLNLRKIMYQYDQIKVVSVGASEDNPSIGGFVKQKCYDHPQEKDVEHYCIFANPQFSNHRGMVLFIRPSFLKTKLDELHIFNEEKVITDEQRAEFPYELVHMPHKGGLGSVATRKLQLGDRVVTDHALVTVFANCMHWQRDDWKAILKDMVDLLPIKGRELFARQHGVGDTELDWISSAFDRNVFSASKDDEGHGGFAFIPEPAYLNHDCRPNVAYYFDDLTLQLEMFAIRDIAPGEELFDSYRQLDLTWEARQDTLYHHYGFKCKCSQCNLPPWAISISDDRIEQIHQLSAVLSNWTAQPPPTTAMAEHLIALYKMEHMEAAIDTPYSLASLAYNSYGESDKASMYASIAISYGIYINGPDWPSYQAHAMLEKEPKNHWSYRSRLPNGPAGPKPDANVEATEEKKETTFSIISEESK